MNRLRFLPVLLLGNLASLYLRLLNLAFGTKEKRP